MVESLKIIGLGLVAAIAYGIAHDNVTARVCVEYFTIGHARIFGPTESPTLLALGWGFVATWWVGLGLGIYLALTCRVGRRPRLSANDLLRPVGILLATMAVVSLIAGLAGYFAATRQWITLNDLRYLKMSDATKHAFLADACAHLAAYATAFVGGIVLAIWATVRRVRLAKAPLSHDSNGM